jgi:hypothetical protein
MMLTSQECAKTADSFARTSWTWKCSAYNGCCTITNIITSRLFLIYSTAEMLHIGKGTQSCWQIVALELIATNVIATIAATSSQSDVETDLDIAKKNTEANVSLDAWHYTCNNLQATSALFFVFLIWTTNLSPLPPLPPLLSLKPLLFVSAWRTSSTASTSFQADISVNFTRNWRRILSSFFGMLFLRW